MFDMTPNPRGTHLQIAEALRNAIRQGVYPSRLPAASELMKTYDISRSTASRALNILKDEGLIESVQGSGWFVKGTVDTRPADIRLRELINDMKLRPGDRLVGEEQIALHLGVSRITIRSALAQLEGEGLISPASTKGRTVL